MRKLSIVIFFILAICSMSLAQSVTSTGCPAISVSAPAGIAEVNELVKYTANVDLDENQKQNLEYIWSTSAGEIVSGQGSAVIEVRQPEQGLTVTVEVKGLFGACPNTASVYTDRCPGPAALKIGQFGGADPTSDEISLSEIVQTMNDNPNSQLYVYFAYKNKPASEPSLRRERKLIENLAVVIGGRERITSVRLFEGVDLIQFWRVPPGAENPSCERCDVSCPTITITGPAGVPKPGEWLEFTAQVFGDIPPSATYRWTVTDYGQNLEGQGTLRLRVKTPNNNGFEMTATLEILGLNSGCPNFESASAPVACNCSPLLMDEFTRLPLREQMRRLDSAVHSLRARSNTKVLFIEYFVKGSSRSRINRRIRWITDQMKRRRVSPPEFEILTSDSFDGDPRTKIYFIPPDTANPAP